MGRYVVQSYEKASIMELYFGVAGTPERRAPTFQQLLAFSQESNPGSEVRTDRGRALEIGYQARRYVTWPPEPSEHAGVRLHLNGEILFLDGQATAHQGTVEAELAQVASLYQQHGTSVWDHLDGNFCLLIEDGPVVHIGVDPVGTRSIYWWEHEGLLAFHSHFLDLAPCYPGTLTEFSGAIGNLLASGIFPPGCTAYREVRRLLPGSYLTFEAGKVRERLHFRLVAIDPYSEARAQDLIEELQTLLAGALARCWRAAERPTIPLSGGADSRYLAAEATRLAQNRSDVRTITWGEGRERPRSDATIAAEVAQALGVENEWHEKSFSYDTAEWYRAVYLSGGEADCAIQYPGDHVLHQSLRERWDFHSLFRGDEAYDTGLPLASDRPLLGIIGVGHLTYDEGRYARWLDATRVSEMAQEQAELLRDILQRLESPTSNTRRDELFHQFQFPQRRVVYNRIKHVDFEVYNPHLARSVLDWNTRVPDRLRKEKHLMREAMRQRHPAVSDIPFATVSNLPAWEGRFQHEPEFARLYVEICRAPGWLDGIADKRKLLTTLEACERNASATTATPALFGPPAMRQWTNAAKSWAKHTLPGRRYVLSVAERHSVEHMPAYLRFGRLATLHTLLGQVAARQARIRQNVLPEVSAQ